MPKFACTYIVTIEKTYSITVSARDEDSAREKLEERIDNLRMKSKPYPGDLEEELENVEIDNIDQE